MFFGIGLFVGGLIGIFIGIGLNFIGVSSVSWTDGITAISTSIIAVLTIVLAVETWRLRILQNKQIREIRKNAIAPLVNLKLEISPAERIFLNLVLENNGIGIAKNINFSIINKTENQNTGAEKLIGLIKKTGFIESGTDSLGINESRQNYLFRFPDFTEKFGDSFYSVKIEILISYEDNEGNSYKNVAIFKISEYKEITTLGGAEPLYQIAQNTKKIAENIKIK